MDEFAHLEGDERIKAENDFLKMKLMLEQGAVFGSGMGAELPAAIEHRFLANVIAFEEQFNNPKSIRLFDKIGRPEIFKPVSEIADENIDSALDELLSYLNEYGISLDVCSPNISSQELYRFATEELFEYEMDDMNLPGWTTCFTYDEFHPDPVYDNTYMATENCINRIFCIQPLKYMFSCYEKDLRLNEYYPLTSAEFMETVNRFKLAYNDIVLDNLEVSGCVVNEKDSTVNGRYQATAAVPGQVTSFSGQWTVILELDEPGGYWNIKSVSIEGVSF
jgi:hypothetical protein